MLGICRVYTKETTSGWVRGEENVYVTRTPSTTTRTPSTTKEQLLLLKEHRLLLQEQLLLLQKVFTYIYYYRQIGEDGWMG